MIGDHRKTWRITTPNLDAAECVSAFKDTFAGRAQFGINASWRLSRDGAACLAIYEGKKNGVATIISDTAGAEDRAAMGSVVRFEAADQPGGGAECDMWLGEYRRWSILRMVAAKGTISAYMRLAAGAIEALDGDARVVKLGD